MTNSHPFTNFGDLYRAAYAELNPSTKQLLLAEVKSVLDRWQESVRDAMPPSSDEGSCGNPFGQAA
ncbi:MAG: hypothetical protein DMG81_10955 [Acidobacteria bacterium]|nr:MAG: hypothetical protein DMG81_10955 [Acidobacteriota bacterium]